MTSSNMIRAARAMLGWSAQELANRADVHISTVQRIEQSGGELRGNVKTVGRVISALDEAGIEFSSTGDRDSVSLRNNKNYSRLADTVK